MSDQHGAGSEEALAVEIGKAFLNAQRMADQIVADARERAAGLLGPPKAGRHFEADAIVTRSYRSHETALAQAAAAMLDELNEVERQLQSRQAQLVELLDGYLETFGPVGPTTQPATAPNPPSDLGVPMPSVALSAPVGAIPALDADFLTAFPKTGTTRQGDAREARGGTERVAPTDIVEATTEAHSQTGGAVDAWAPPSGLPMAVTGDATTSLSAASPPAAAQDPAEVVTTSLDQSATTGPTGQGSTASWRGSSPKRQHSTSNIRANLIALTATLVVLIVLLVLVNTL